jgi:hypothetical protein
MNSLLETEISLMLKLQLTNSKENEIEVSRDG